jgi:hypothetical protein
VPRKTATQIHPAADCFPMLSDEELNELSADIAKNGLREPLVLQKINGKDTLVDGRNRRKACELAGVEPDVRYLEEDVDPVAYIFSTNIARRHLTAGQRAIIHARLYPNGGGKGGRGNKTRLNSGEIKVGRDTLTRARYVLQHPDLADQVMAGLSLNRAYEQAKERDKDTKAWNEALEFLKENAPDLAAEVMEEGKSPFQAKKEYKERLDKARVERLGFWRVLESMKDYATTFTPEGMSRLEAYIKEHRDECPIDTSDLSRDLAKVSAFLKKV